MSVDFYRESLSLYIYIYVFYEWRWSTRSDVMVRGAHNDVIWCGARGAIPHSAIRRDATRHKRHVAPQHVCSAKYEHMVGSRLHGKNCTILVFDCRILAYIPLRVSCAVLGKSVQHAAPHWWEGHWTRTAALVPKSSTLLPERSWRPSIHTSPPQIRRQRELPRTSEVCPYIVKDLYSK